MTSTNQSTTGLDEVYSVERADEALARLISPRHVPFSVLAPVWEEGEKIAYTTVEDSYILTDAMLTKIGATDLVGCSTFERAHPKRRGWAHRPVPHFAKQSDQAALLALYNEHGPEMYRIILSEIVPPVQSYDKNSRLGAPYYSVEKHKLQKLMPHFEAFAAGNLSIFDQMLYVINNVRLQAEKKSKVREFVFLGKGGRPYLKAISAEDRFDTEYGRFASRLRLVFNYPITNLWIQILDTAIHHWWLTHTACKHNMASRVGTFLPGFKRFVDVKHFERAVGTLVQKRHEFIGGMYSAVMKQMLQVPYLVPADDGLVYSMRLNHKAGYIEQLGSGVSAVAPIGKEALFLCYGTFFSRRLNIPWERGFRTALAGGTADVQIMNYGDDNILYGKESEVLACFEFLSKHLTVEEEKPPRFLGHYYDDEKGFFLGRQSYVANFYLAERAPRTRFRPYPFLGMKLRKELFAKMGDPFIRNELYPFETDLLASRGYTPSIVDAAAHEEAQSLSDEGLSLNPLVVMGKEYLLTDEEKRADVNFDVLGPEITAKYLAVLVGER